MAYSFLDIVATPSVRAAQASMGSGDLWATAGTDRQYDRLGPDEVDFIARRDSFYMATVSESGWPYVQHRGGPPGFLKVVDETTLAFADYRGNRQYITLGNLGADSRACLILVDYVHRARMKVLAHAEAVALDADPALRDLVLEGSGKARPERILRLKLAAFDWNCPQHIVQRFTEAEVAQAMAPVREAIAALQAENARLRAQLTQSGG